MKSKILFLIAMLTAAVVHAQTTAFSFQGQLYDGGAPANGHYDFDFIILDAATNGNLLGETTNGDVLVTNGLFNAVVDFGASPFGGPPRWLEVSVRTNGSLGQYTNLYPLDMITAAPYAITANSASNLLGTLAATNLTGSLAASQLPAGLVSNGQNNVTLTGTFIGNGSGLTGLTASQLTGGTLPLAQLPSGVVTNNETFLTLGGTFNGFFSGNGNGLNSINAGTLIGTIPSSVLTSVPAGNLTGTVPGGALAGTYGNAVSLINPGNVIAGTILNSLSSSLTNEVGALTVTNMALFTNAIVNITNSNGQGVLVGPGGVTNSGNLRIGGWLVGPTTNAGRFWITNGALFVTNVGLSSGVILGGNTGNIAFSGTITGNGAGLTDGSGNPLGTSISNLALTIGGNDTNFALNASNVVMLGASNSVFLASNTVYAAANTLALGASNTLEAALLAAGTTLSNYAQSGNVILSNFVAAGGTLPALASLTNPTLRGPLFIGPSTNTGSLWLTNGMLLVTNSTGSVTVNSGNIVLSGTITGNGAGLTDASGNPLGTSISNLALTIGGNDTNFALNVSNIVMLGASNSVFSASNTLETALLSAGTTLSNYAQSGNVILSNFVAAGATLPALASLTNPALRGPLFVGPSTNTGSLWLTNGTLLVTNSAGSVTITSGNIAFSGAVTGDGAGLTDASGNPLGTSISNLALTIGANNTNFTLNASNVVMLGASNSVFLASNAVYAAANTLALAASNTLEAALLSAGTTVSNYAQSGNIILSNFVAAGGTLPTLASLTNPVLRGPLFVGPSTNSGNLWLTNGTLLVTNSTGSVTMNNGNIAFSGTITGNGSGLTGVTAVSPTSANYVSSYSATTQSTATPNFFQTILLAAPSEISGWIYGGGNFTCTQTGLYLVQYTAEAQTPNGLGSVVTIESLQNGTAINGAGVKTTFNGIGAISLSQSFIVNVLADQSLVFEFTGDSTDVELVSSGTAPSFSVNILRLQ